MAKLTLRGNGDVTEGVLALIVLGAFGFIFWNVMKSYDTQRMADKSYQDLPQRVRDFDTNRDGYFGAREMHQLTQKYELVERNAPESR